MLLCEIQLLTQISTSAPPFRKMCGDETNLAHETTGSWLLKYSRILRWKRQGDQVVSGQPPAKKRHKYMSFQQ
jgi:hypothetical protein